MSGCEIISTTSEFRGTLMGQRIGGQASTSFATTFGLQILGCLEKEWCEIVSTTFDFEGTLMGQKI